MKTAFQTAGLVPLENKFPILDSSKTSKTLQAPKKGMDKKMMKLNGKEFKIPELNFNTMCQLEDMGISLSEMDKKPMAAIRGFISLAIGGDLEMAGKELEMHIINGGKLDDIMQEVVKAVNESGFFRALSQTTTKETSTSKDKESTAKKSK